MAGIVIYLPGRRGADPRMLREVGLGSLLADGDSGPSFADVLENGPDGGAGVLLFWDNPLTPDRTPRLTVADNTWQPAKRSGTLPGGRFWLGQETGGIVRPCDLERRTMQPGGDVILEDGQAWHVPVARQLPRVLGLDDLGNVSGRVRDEYKAFFDAAWASIERFQLGEGGLQIPYDDGFDFCALALSINYRVNRDVADFLGIIGTAALFEIPKVVCELEELVNHFQKKSVGDTRPIAVGVPG